MNLEKGPFLFGTPEAYAPGKAKEFPNEGGPAILVVEVPEEIVLKAVNPWFPLSQGLTAAQEMRPIPHAGSRKGREPSGDAKLERRLTDWKELASDLNPGWLA